ncbi:MAG TPA: hypothetical protein VHU89_13535 [Acidobacteriaceae bacterium]|jgi:hypothetical protein|nr:hypothetical protein [Acidobacteriaceae bacterium]
MALSLFEKREELRRVLQSRQFAGAPKRARFLEFVCEQAFLGNGEKLNEFLIGVEVYDRGSEFSPQRDPIVRVQAHEIRRSLKKYYEEGGAENTLRIDLPSGHYVPVFSRSAPEAPEPSAPNLPGAPSMSGPLHLAITVILGTLCVALAVFLILALQRRQPSAPAPSAAATLPEGLKWFWGPFLPPARAPLIVIPNHPVLRAAHNGDSAETVARGHEIPKADLPEFRDTIHFRELRRFVFVPSLTDFTAVGETLGVVRLCEMFFRVGGPCRVQPSRLVNFEEIRNGNAILLGGSQAWSGRVFLEAQGFHLQGGVILNRNPQPGERAEYKPEFDPVTNQLTRDYALILMLPNQEKENRVLLIYGIYTQGSQAAIEYLLDPDRMAVLHKALLAASLDHKTAPRYFQALLTTTVENAVPGTSSLVAVRRIQN